MQKCIPGSEHRFEERFAWIGNFAIAYWACAICHEMRGIKQHKEEILHVHKMTNMSPFERDTYMLINEDKLKNVWYVEKDPV